MGTNSWNSGDWLRVGASSLVGGPIGAVAGYGYNSKKNAGSAARVAAGEANTQAANARTQTSIAEDERLRRLRLLQGGLSNTMEEATGRKTLLGQ